MSNSTSLPHLLLLGATGRTGRLLMADAFSQGYTITALIRNAASLDDLPTDQRARLQVVQGDPTEPQALAKALQAALSYSKASKLVIVSTLGQTRKSGNPWAEPTSPPMFITKTTRALVDSVSQLDAASTSRIARFVILTGFGSGSSWENLHCAFKPIMTYSQMKQTIEDQNGVDAVLRQQEVLTWIQVRSSMFKEGDARPVIVRPENGDGQGWLPSSITTGSVVKFMLECVDDSRYDGTAPVIAN